MSVSTDETERTAREAAAPGSAPKQRAKSGTYERQGLTPGERLLEQRQEAEYQRDLGSVTDIRYLMPSMREYKLDSWITIIFMVLEAIADLLIPTFVADLIDQGVSKGNMAQVWRWGGILALCAVFALLFGGIANVFGARASAGFARNLRHDTFHAVQNFSFANIDHFSTGSIITRTTTDVTNVQNAYQGVLIIASRAPIMMVVAWILSYRLSRPISLGFLVILPILLILFIIIAAVVHPYFIRVFHTYDRLNASVDEDLSGIRVVKSFTRENYQVRGFKRISQRIYTLFAKAEYRLALNNPVANICMFAIQILICWMAAHEIVQSGNNPARGLTTGGLTSLLSYSGSLLSAVFMLSMVFILIIISRASVSRIAAVLREKNTMTFKPAGQAITVVRNGQVDFDHVTFRYDQEGTGDNVLSDINLHIPSGSTVGIIGVTGSAKTSLVQLIPRLYDATEGTVSVGGHDVRDYDLKTLRTQVAMVLQKNTLFEGTIAENLRWGDPKATDEEVRHAAILAQADEFVQRLPKKYDTHIDQGGTNVSGGQRQRLTIARALLRKPKILILDDSTSAVDTKTDALIRRALATEIPATTKIIIAQRLSSVENADQIYILRDGRILAHGTNDELLKSSPEYRAIYETQNRTSEKKAAIRQAEKAQHGTTAETQTGHTETTTAKEEK